MGRWIDRVRWGRRVVLVGTLGVLAACGGGESLQRLAMERVVQPWRQTTLQETYVIRSEAEWQRVWNLHVPVTVAPVPLPRVDFSQSMVLGLTAGTGPNGCYGLSIQQVWAGDGAVEVEYRLAEPGPTSVCTLATVALTDFVVVKRVEGAVVFRRITG